MTRPTWRRLALATRENAKAVDRTARLGAIAREWVFAAEGVIPERYPEDLFPGISSVTGRTTLAIGHHFELPYGERLVLDALARHLKPDRIVEMGTFTGTTTLLLSTAAPDAKIDTFDLPGDNPVVGSAFRSHDENITLHRADLGTFDFTNWNGTVDFVFVDASHEESDVARDSRTALGLLSPRGVVVWDDYQAAQAGVVAALNALGTSIPLARIAGTRLVTFGPGNRH